MTHPVLTSRWGLARSQYVWGFLFSKQKIKKTNQRGRRLVQISRVRDSRFGNFRPWKASSRLVQGRIMRTDPVPAATLAGSMWATAKRRVPIQISLAPLDKLPLKTRPRAKANLQQKKKRKKTRSQFQKPESPRSSSEKGRRTTAPKEHRNETHRTIEMNEWLVSSKDLGGFCSTSGLL